MAPKKKHEFYNTKEYRCWRALKSRCNNPNHAQYKDYGGRGITVCERWNAFLNFYEDMGKSPEGSEIDRIDNNKGYFKENCRWTTRKTNSRNRRSTKKHKMSYGSLVQQELIEQIGWTKNQFRWFIDRYGIEWIIKNFKDGTLPQRTNIALDKEEMIGKTYGKWTVLSFVRYKKSDGNRYLCRCACGEEKEVIGYHLRSGKSTRCRSCAYKDQENKPNKR